MNDYLNPCFNCGYNWADLDKNGTPISKEYCHFVGPESWAPCYGEDHEEDDFDFYEVYEQFYAKTFESMVDPTFEEYGAPYDYGDDYYVGWDADELCQEGLMERTIRVWLGDEYIEWISEEIPDDWEEDEIFEAACDAVYSNIQIEVF